MAVSSNALSLAEYAVQSNDPLVQAITFSLLDNGTVLDDIPFITKASLLANGVRWEGNLPGVNWAKINAEPTAVKGQPTPFQESVFIVRNNIDVDHYLVEDQNQIMDPRTAQANAWLKSFAYDFNDKFINNDHATGDSNAIVGVKARIDNPTVYGVKNSGSTNYQKIDVNLDMSQANAATNANKFLEAIDQLLWSVGASDGNGVVLYMNEVMKRRFAFALRSLGTSGGYAVTQDQYGRTVESFRGARIRDIGYKADQITRIITVTETTAGAATGSTYTSIYAVRYAEDALMGWQFAPLSAKNMGITENGVTYRTLLDWAAGLFPNSNRSFARAYDIKIS